MTAIEMMRTHAPTTASRQLAVMGFVDWTDAQGSRAMRSVMTGAVLVMNAPVIARWLAVVTAWCGLIANPQMLTMKLAMMVTSMKTTAAETIALKLAAAMGFYATI